MSDPWQTIEQAAVTLGLSVRTVNRHITAGKLQSRLFEGRREVLVADTDSFASLRPSSESSVQQSQPNFTLRSNPASPNGSDAVMNGSTAADRPTDESTVAESSSDTRFADSSSWSPYSPSTSDRQRVSPEVAVDRPMDLQTMLALTDSIDDKATLAVAAYQTLARSAETQVQSLRRAAYGAWAVVGLMGAGITVAVGWAAIRLTSAETSAAYLKEQLERTNGTAAQNQALTDQLAVARAEAKVREEIQQAYERGTVDGMRQSGAGTRRGANDRTSPAPVGAFPLNPLSIPPPVGVPVGAPLTDGQSSGIGADVKVPGVGGPAGASHPSTVPTRAGSNPGSSAPPPTSDHGTTFGTK